MRREHWVGPFGIHELDMDEIVLTARERAILARAARILHDLRAARYPDYLTDEDDLNTDIALAAYTIDDIGERIPAGY